jgi:hypothetical protein
MMLKSPLPLVVVEAFVLFFTETVTPGNGTPPSPVTFPVMALGCAWTLMLMVIAIAIIAIRRNCFVIFILAVFSFDQ